MKPYKRILLIVGCSSLALLELAVVSVAYILLFLSVACPLKRETLGEYPSPDSKHVVTIVLSDGGATTPWTIVASVRGTWILGSRTIYAQDHIEEATVKWLNDRTVRINGVSLDIYTDKYSSHDYPDDAP